MLSASTIILEYVCPGLGVLICQFMFSAPYQDLKEAIQRGNIGDLNPTPWAFMLGNCFGWVTYGILTQNLFIFWANAPGFCLSVYLNLGAVKLLYQRHHATEMRKSFVAFLAEEESKSKRDLRIQEKQEKPNDWATIVWNVTSQTTPAPAPHETLVLGIVMVWTICMSLLGFAQSFDSHVRESIVGTLVNLNLVFFYGAPLSTIYTVLKLRNSSSIHIRTMITNTLNGVFWCAYGIAVLDPFVYVPNGLGAVLGAIQIVLIVIFPRIPSTDAAKSENVLELMQPEECQETTLPLTTCSKGQSEPSSCQLLEEPEFLEGGGIDPPAVASTDGSSIEEGGERHQ